MNPFDFGGTNRLRLVVFPSKAMQRFEAEVKEGFDFFGEHVVAGGLMLLSMTFEPMEFKAEGSEPIKLSGDEVWALSRRALQRAIGKAMNAVLEAPPVSKTRLVKPKRRRRKPSPNQ